MITDIMVNVYAWNLHHWYLGAAFVVVALLSMAVCNYRQEHPRGGDDQS